MEIDSVKEQQMARGNANLRVEVIDDMVHLPDMPEVGPLPMYFSEDGDLVVLDVDSAGVDLTMDPSPTDDWESGVMPPWRDNKKWTWYFQERGQSGRVPFASYGSTETKEQAERMIERARDAWNEELA